MRKKDKQINDPAEIENILSRALICRLALCQDNQPYIVPLCFGYKNNALYFHCAAEGKKLDIIKKNNNVCFEIDIDCEPIKSNKPCDWTMKYKSVIGFGRAVFLKDTESKRKALDVIMKHFSVETFDYPLEVIKKTTIIKVEIETMTGKQSY